MPEAYSVRQLMATQPYALGERPGGNYIPTIPLLSGTDAWDSLTQYHTNITLPYDTSLKGPRPGSRDYANKAAAIDAALGVPGFELLYGAMRSQRSRPMTKAAAHTPQTSFDALVSDFIQVSPVVYGFVQSQLEKGASYCETVDQLRTACDRFPKFAEACYAATPVLNMFELEAEGLIKQAIGQGRFTHQDYQVGGRGYAKHRTEKHLTEKNPDNLPINVGSTNLSGLNKLDYKGMGQFKNRLDQRGASNWGYRNRNARDAWEQGVRQRASQNASDPNWQQPRADQVYNPHRAAATSHMAPYNQAMDEWQTAYTKQQNARFGVPTWLDASTTPAPQMPGEAQGFDLADIRHRIATDYWMGQGLPPGMELPEGVSLPKGDPSATAMIKRMSEETGLDTYTLLRGMQAEQSVMQAHPQLDPDARAQAAKKHQEWLASGAGRDPQALSGEEGMLGDMDHAAIAETVKNLPPRYRDALKAYQHAQMSSTRMYRGRDYGSRGKLNGRVYPGSDNPMWQFPLREGTMDHLQKKWDATAPEQRHMLQDPSKPFMGGVDDYEGMGQLAERWGVDVRDEAFQNFWQQKQQDVAEHGWGNQRAGTPRQPGDLMQQYANWKSGYKGLIDTARANNAPYSMLQRLMGDRRKDPRTGKEIMISPDTNEPGLNFFEHAGGAGLTALSALGALPAVGADLLQAMGGNTGFDYSKMMGRSLMQYPNNIAQTDFGHNVRIARPGFQKGDEGHGYVPAHGNMGMWGNPLTGNSSAAARWAQIRGFPGDPGHLQVVPEYLEASADKPGTPFGERVDRRTLANVLRWAEVPLELFVGSKGLGAVSNATKGAKGVRAFRMANPRHQTLRSLAMRRLRDLIPGGLDVGSKGLGTLGRFSAPMASPFWRGGQAAFGEIPLGDGNLMRHKQEAGAQGFREWGSQEDAGIVQNILGELGATGVESGPIMLAGAAGSQFVKSPLRALGAVVGGRPSQALIQGSLRTKATTAAKSLLSNPFFQANAVGSVATPSFARFHRGNDGGSQFMTERMEAMRDGPVTFNRETNEIEYKPGGWYDKLMGNNTWESRNQALDLAGKEMEVYNSLATGEELTPAQQEFVQLDPQLMQLQQDRAMYDQVADKLSRGEGLTADERAILPRLPEEMMAELSAIQQGAPTPTGRQLGGYEGLPPAFTSHTTPDQPGVPGVPGAPGDEGISEVAGEMPPNEPQAFGPAPTDIQKQPAAPASTAEMSPLSPEQINFPRAFGIDQNKMKDAGPEAEVQLGQAVEQVITTANQIGRRGVTRMQTEIQSGDPEAPASQKATRNIVDQTGMGLEDAWRTFQNMDDGAKMMIGLGVTLGTVSLISSIAGEGGTIGVLGAILGFGAAGGMLAHGGVFGNEARDFTQGLMGMLGMGAPEQTAEEKQKSLASPEGGGGQPAALMDAKGTPDAIKMPVGTTGEQPRVPAGAIWNDVGGFSPAVTPAAKPPVEAPVPVGAKTEPPVPAAAPPANPQQTAFRGFMDDRVIDRQEMSEISGDPKMREYVFGLPDDAALDTLRAVAKGDPKMAKQLASIKRNHKSYGQEIAAALAKPRGKTSNVGPAWFPPLQEEVPGMGFTPEQAKRFVALASQL